MTTTNTFESDWRADEPVAADDLGAVAIVGLAGRFPDAPDLDRFWQNLANGVDSVKLIDDETLRRAGVDAATLADARYVKACAMLGDIDRFDAAFFGISAREAEVMDPQHRLFLECAWEALEHAGYAARTHVGAIGVFGGTAISNYLVQNLATNRHVLATMGARQLYMVNEKDFMCGRVAYELNLHGPAVAVQTACSTSLVAVHMACQSVLSGECDMALAGGVAISHLAPTGYLYEEGGLNSRDGHCRAFDADATGIITGSGAGIVVLKSLAAALRDGDTIHAVIRGSAINNDGNAKVSFTAPSIAGQEAVIGEALAIAGVTADTIGYVEAHGTGTLMGDPVEFSALASVFGEQSTERQYCALGSLKTNLGHLDTAAGVAGLIKTVLALRAGEVPPSLHFDAPNPHIDFESSPFFVNTARRAWPLPGPRRACVSSFGIGGTNAHVVLEQAPAAVAPGDARPAELMVLSARSPRALDDACKRLADHLDAHPELALRDVAHTLQQGREAFRHRRVVAARTLADACAQWRERGARAALPDNGDDRPAPVVFLLPGGGAQHAGMGRGLYESQPVFRAVIDECAALLRPTLGLDVRDLLYPSDDRAAEATAQMLLSHLGLPALFATEVATARQLEAWGVVPEAMVGHSLGEYVAAHLAGVFSLADGLKLVAARGRLLSGLPAMNMLAVLRPASEMRPLLGDALWLACENSSRSCTIAGTPESTRRLADRLGAEGIDFQLLENWPASHSGLMDPIMDEFRAAFDGVRLNVPTRPYLSNLTGDWIRPEQATDVEHWVAHLRNTVRFADCLAQLKRDPMRVYVELGPGQTLGNLLRHELGEATISRVAGALPRAKTVDCSVRTALAALGHLWAHGATVSWPALQGDTPARRVPLPTYAFQRQRYWIDAGLPPVLGEADATSASSERDIRADDVESSADLARHERPALAIAYKAPGSDTERRLCACWEHILGIAPVGIDDDFFQLGGSSLIAIQLVSRLRAAFDVELPLRTLFAVPTVAGQAHEIDAVQQGATPPTACTRIPVRAPGTLVPASHAQQRLLFLGQLDREAISAYHVAKAIRIEGALRVDVLHATLDRIVARHESLRTRFAEVDGVAIQVVDAAGSGFALTLDNLDHLGGQEQQNAVSLHMLDECERGFDLRNDPLIRGRLMRLAPDVHVLLVTQHHIISDGWSIGVLVREVSTLYPALCEGQPDPLPALPVQFGDYALWQRDRLAGAHLDTLTAFWRSQLTGAPALLSLPADRARPELQRYEGAHVPFSLGPELSTALRCWSQRHGATLFMSLLAGWSVLLSRLSGQDDVVVGTPVANRPRAELEGLIGFFVNTLALRVRLDDDPSVAALLARVKAGTLQAFEHQELPLEEVVDAVRPVRSTSHGPLFQAMINVHDTPGDSRLDVAGLAFTPVETAENRVQCDIVLSVQAGGDEVVGTLNYSTALFDADTVARMSQQLRCVIAAMVASDDCAVSRLPLHDALQRRAVVEGFNATAAATPRERLMHRLFEDQVVAHPDDVALGDGEVSLTYDELNRRANQLARRLRALGITPDDKVVLFMERSVAMVVAMLAVLKAGGAYVALDVTTPTQRLADMLDDVRAIAVIAPSGLVELLPPLVGPLATTLIEIDVEAAALAREGQGDLAPLPDQDSSSLACIVFTSGSTGRPKGVMVEHRNIVPLVVGNHYAPLGRGDCIAHCANPAFDASTWEIWGALLTGARVSVVTKERLLDTARFARHLVDEQVSALFLTVALLNQCAEALKTPLARLDYLLFGGEKIVLGNLLRTLGANPPRHVVHVYGPTETTTYATSFEAFCRPGLAHADVDSLPIGRPIANTRAYILDKHGEPAAVGVAGEVFIGGDGVTRGYLNRPELSAERFVPDAFGGVDGARLYRTGDLARWRADGAIEYLGRNDFQVKIRGFRIELGEIETRLLQCAGVADAVVVAREDSPGDKRLVAYVVAHPGETLRVAVLRDTLARSLTEVMVPTAWMLVDALPLTPNGKVDRKALPAPDASASAQRGYEAPRGDIEQAVAAIWGELLGLEQVGRHDHFFELGGHSLMVAQATARLNEHLGSDIALMQVFQAPTPAALAEVVVQAELARYGAADIAALMSDIEGLSDAEIERLLESEEVQL
jgi:amino acid adenylation domain-containing protein